ncbi:MAG: cytochrome c oxidase assembly protein, partial [Pseudomonadota bacterium]
LVAFHPIRLDQPIMTRYLLHYAPDNASLVIRLAMGELGLPAAYNVTPLKAGKYFHKVQCFCFDEQILEAGDGMDMPVLFYVDPAILEDRKMADVDTITLSYTFFPADTGDLNERIGDYYDEKGVAQPTKASLEGAAATANQPDKGPIDG